MLHAADLHHVLRRYMALLYGDGDHLLSDEVHDGDGFHALDEGVPSDDLPVVEVLAHGEHGPASPEGLTEKVLVTGGEYHLVALGVYPDIHVITSSCRSQTGTCRSPLRR